VEVRIWNDSHGHAFVFGLQTSRSAISTLNLELRRNNGIGDLVNAGSRPIQLLEETEKAVGNTKLSGQHTTLITKSAELKKMDTVSIL